MTKDEALRLALEALELEDMACRYEKDQTPEHITKAIIAIREALAQPEQQPVAWATQVGEYAHIKWGAKRPEYPTMYEVPLYTTPPHRKPLMDEEIDKLPWEPHEGNPMTFAEGLRYFARAIEAAHGIKE